STTFVDDYPEAGLVAAFKCQDVVIATVTIQGIGQQKPVIDAALKAGVKRFVPFEFGTDTFKENGRDLMPSFKHSII
ncbi:MAG: hypothetical protein LQ340_005736, partial [Diploschistes diacapsis]